VRNTVIQPGEEHTESYVLNIFNRLNAPGTYTVQVARGRPFYADGRPEWPDGVKAEANFTVTVNETPVDPELLQPWARQLRSTDSGKRLEAAFVLAAVAPKSLEDTLLTFADDPWIHQYAPLALHRLNTPRSIEALKKLVASTDPNSWEHRKASEYLANEPCIE